MDEETRDRLLHRLVKLQRLAENPGTPEEGEAALRKIKLLMAKYPDLAPAPRPTPPPNFGNAWFDQMVRTFYEDQRRARAEQRRRAGEHIPTDPFVDPRSHAERQRAINNSWRQPHPDPDNSARKE